jgi:hypothetical protein
VVLRAPLVATAFIAALFSLPVPSCADPISFLFDVNVTSVQGSFPVPSFQPRFQLIATFDDQITSLQEGPDFREEIYGQVRFSSVPLPAPAPFPNHPLSVFRDPESSNGYLERDHEFLRFARLGLAQVQLDQRKDQVWDRFILIELPFRAVVTSSRPTLTPRTLAMAAGTPSDTPNFEFTSNRFPEGGPFTDGVTYMGFATFC